MNLKISLHRFFLLFILVIYISVSHVILPAFNKANFLFFSDWVLFSFMPQKHIYDISWDEGKTFLLRDHRQKFTFPFIQLNRFVNSLVFFPEHEIIKKDFYSEIKTLCNCQKLEIFKLKGTLSEHIIYKKQLPVEKQNIL